MTDATLYRGTGGGTGRPLFVLHDVGEPAGAAVWQPLLDAWPGVAVAADLPGHGGSPPPVGAKWVPSDLALFAVRAMAQAGLIQPVVVGHGWGGWAAELLGAGARVAAVVLVDGLGPPWQSYAEIDAEGRAWLRGMLDDPLVARPVEYRPDPLVAHGFPSEWERRFVEQVRGAVSVPVLALESSSSRTPEDQRDGRVAAYGAPASWLAVASAAPATIAAALGGHPGWWG